MASRTVKVAVSLPREAFEQLERRREQLGLSRSALVAQAIRSWLGEQGEAEGIRRYLEGYEAQPETAEEIDEARALALQTLASQAWDE